VAIKRVCRFRVGDDNVAQLMRRLMHPAIQIGKSEAMHRFELNASADYRERARRSDRRFLLRCTAAIIVTRAADSFAPAPVIGRSRMRFDGPSAGFFSDRRADRSLCWNNHAPLTARPASGDFARARARARAGL